MLVYSLLQNLFLHVLLDITFNMYVMVYNSIKIDQNPKSQIAKN
jgi:hypothetical protein